MSEQLCICSHLLNKSFKLYLTSCAVLSGLVIVYCNCRQRTEGTV